MEGIRMSDCKFYVNEAERTVVCVIPNTDFTFCKFIEDNFNFPDINFDYSISSWNNHNIKELRMPRSFSGRAVCAEEDEWNEELGRMIAFSRAKNKFYKTFFKRANFFVNLVDRRLSNMVEIFNNMGEKLDAKRSKLEQAIENRIK